MWVGINWLTRFLNQLLFTSHSLELSKVSTIESHRKWDFKHVPHDELGAGFKYVWCSSLCGENDPNWLIFFRRVETTNKRYLHILYTYCDAPPPKMQSSPPRWHYNMFRKQIEFLFQLIRSTSKLTQNLIVPFLNVRMSGIQRISLFSWYRRVYDLIYWRIWTMKPISISWFTVTGTMLLKTFQPLRRDQKSKNPTFWTQSGPQQS